MNCSPNRYKDERPTVAGGPFWVALTPTLRHWRAGVTMKATATPGTATAMYHTKQQFQPVPSQTERSLAAP
jgi:hypothetical protein